MAVSEKIDPVEHGENVIFAKRKFEVVAEKGRYLCRQIVQIAFVIVKYTEVVAVPNVWGDPVGLNKPLVQLVEIEVSQPLGRIVPDRDVPAARVAVNYLTE